MPVAIENLVAESLPEAVRLLSSQLEDHRIELATATLAHAVRELLVRPELGKVFLLRKAGEAVGVAAISFTWTLEHGGKVAWLEELYVAPEMRGLGYGRMLLAHSLRAAQADGAVAVDLEVDREHRSVEAMYQRAGFVHRDRSRWSLTFRGPQSP